MCATAHPTQPPKKEPVSVETIFGSGSVGIAGLAAIGTRIVVVAPVPLTGPKALRNHQLLVSDGPGKGAHLYAHTYTDADAAFDTHAYTHIQYVLTLGQRSVCTVTYSMSI